MSIVLYSLYELDNKLNIKALIYLSIQTWNHSSYPSFPSILCSPQLVYYSFLLSWQTQKGIYISFARLRWDNFINHNTDSGDDDNEEGLTSLHPLPRRIYDGVLICCIFPYYIYSFIIIIFFIFIILSSRWWWYYIQMVQWPSIHVELHSLSIDSLSHISHHIIYICCIYRECEYREWKSLCGQQEHWLESQGKTAKTINNK